MSNSIRRKAWAALHGSVTAVFLLLWLPAWPLFTLYRHRATR